MSPALKITGVVADYNLQIDVFNFPTIIVNIIIIIIIVIIIVIIIIIIIIITTKPFIENKANYKILFTINFT